MSYHVTDFQNKLSYYDFDNLRGNWIIWIGPRNLEETEINSPDDL